jgi:membrane protease YdiL (CAAX protease family)
MGSAAPIPPPPLGPGAVKRLFVGPQGLRALWSVVLFLGILFVAAIVTFGVLHLVARGMLRPDTTQTVSAGTSPILVAFPAYGLVVPVLVATIVMGWIERRSPWTYGFGDRRAIPHFTAGLIWGFLALSALIGLLAITGHVAIGAPAEAAPVALRYAAKWAIAFIGVGLFEESMSRGYLQATVGRSLGFWPAAVLLSVLFGAGHLGNPGETPIGLVGAGAAGLVFCYSLWRSGSIWWGVGFHSAWDWAQSYFYGTPDSGVVSVGRLFDARPSGNTWLSGGTVGPEGSVLVFVVLIAVALVIRWTLPPHAAAPASPLPSTAGAAASGT